MRIVFVTSSAINSGGARQAFYLAKALTERGHDLVFYAPAGSQLPSLGDEVAWRELPPKKIRWGRAISAALTGSHPAVLHAFHNKAVKLAAWWGLFLRRRGVAVMGHRGVVYRPNNPLPYISPGIDGFIVNSQACARVLRSKGVGARRLHVVYNAIPDQRVTPSRPPEEVRRELGMENGQFILGSLIDDSANKGMQHLIPAFGQAVASGALPEHARLTLIGTKQERREKWTALCRESGVEGRVDLIGRRENVADYLQIFDAFVLPSLSESMPNALLEAMHAGLPVVATTVGGVPELVDGNGLLVPPGDVPALREALAKLGDPEQRKAWGEQSAALSKRFSVDYKAELVEKIYRTTLKNRRLPVD